MCIQNMYHAVTMQQIAIKSATALHISIFYKVYTCTYFPTNVTSHVYDTCYKSQNWGKPNFHAKKVSKINKV